MPKEENELLDEKARKKAEKAARWAAARLELEEAEKLKQAKKMEDPTFAARYTEKMEKAAAKAEKQAGKAAANEAKEQVKRERMLADIRGNLAPGEEILDYVDASIIDPNALGLLILTNLRMRFAWEITKTNRPARQQDYFLEDIQTVSQNLKKSSGFHNSRLWIRVGKTSKYFSSHLDKIAEFNEFAHKLSDEVLRTKKPGSKKSPVEPKPGSTEGLDVQLLSLANLHSQGILSDAEFAAAKSKLLGL